MLEGVIGNNVEELPQCSQNKATLWIWFLWNHARELFLCAVHTTERMNRKCNSTTFKKYIFNKPVSTTC